MKIQIDADEWYPVYVVHGSGYEVEATPEQVARWKVAHEAFEAAQSEMGELWDVADEAHREQAAREKAEREATEKAERQRVARERQAAAEEAARAQAAVWDALRESGGVAYDANGNPIGRIEPAGSHGQARVIPLEDRP